MQMRGARPAGPWTDGVTLSRSAEKREARTEADAQLEALESPRPCEDCGQCEGWACHGDATYIPLPGQKADDPNPDACLCCGYYDDPADQPRE